MTEQGQPVAVVLSLEDYERLQPQRSFARFYEAWRASVQPGDLPEEDPFDVRDRTSGREIDL